MSNNSDYVQTHCNIFTDNKYKIVIYIYIYINVYKYSCIEIHTAFKYSYVIIKIFLKSIILYNNMPNMLNINKSNQSIKTI